jgi:hypothetical protein
MATLITRNVTKLSLQQLSLGIEKLNECTKAYIILEKEKEKKKEKKHMEKHDEQLIFFQLTITNPIEIEFLVNKNKWLEELSCIYTFQNYVTVWQKEIKNLISMDADIESFRVWRLGINVRLNQILPDSIFELKFSHDGVLKITLK